MTPHSVYLRCFSWVLLLACAVAASAAQVHPAQRQRESELKKVSPPREIDASASTDLPSGLCFSSPRANVR